MKKKLLVISQSQFGYHIDSYYYCKYLRNEFDIDYYCWDYGHEKLTMDGVRVYYHSRSGSKLLRNTRFIVGAIKLTRSGYDRVIMKHFLGSGLLPIFSPATKMVLDIRSGGIYPKAIYRDFHDIVIRLDSCFFKHVAIISAGLGRRLRIEREKFHLLPLGAEPGSFFADRRDGLHLLYVGTLDDRNIIETLRGFLEFYKTSERKHALSYVLVGSGTKNEEQELREFVADNNLGGHVTIVGRVPHDELGQYYRSQNVGVSYIPMTEYFDFQPPTKTYEYLFAGLPVIATATNANEAVINERNGVLIKDSAREFAVGIQRVADRLQEFEPKAIAESASQYSWENIVRKNLLPFLHSL